MSKSKIHISKCDRCGEEARADAEHASIFYTWGVIWFTQINGVIHAKSRNIPKYFAECNDLCPDCIVELNEWYNKPKTGKF